MPKGLRLEKVTGVVALSYLVLIPVAGYVAFRKIQDLDDDVQILWDASETAVIRQRTPMFSVRDTTRKLLNKKS